MKTTHRAFLDRALSSGRLVFVKRFDGEDKNDLFAVAKNEPAVRSLEPLPWSPPAGLTPSGSPWREDAELTGSIDVPAEGAAVKGPLEVSGWARVPGEDLDVTILVDGERRASASFARPPRVEVCQALPALGDCATRLRGRSANRVTKGRTRSSASSGRRTDASATTRRGVSSGGPELLTPQNRAGAPAARLTRSDFEVESSPPRRPPARGPFVCAPANAWSSRQHLEDLDGAAFRTARPGPLRTVRAARRLRPAPRRERPRTNRRPTRRRRGRGDARAPRRRAPKDRDGENRMASRRPPASRPGARRARRTWPGVGRGRGASGSRRPRTRHLGAAADRGRGTAARRDRVEQGGASSKPFWRISTWNAAASSDLPPSAQYASDTNVASSAAEPFHGPSTRAATTAPASPPPRRRRRRRDDPSALQEGRSWRPDRDRACSGFFAVISSSGRR